MTRPHPDQTGQLDLSGPIGHRLRLRRLQSTEIPRHRLSEEGLPGDLAYQLIHDHSRQEFDLWDMGSWQKTG